MKHDELVEIGYKWVLNKCGFAFKELVSINQTGEVPDVIGFNSIGSFLLEAKTSLADLRREQKKYFRRHSEDGMGDWRFYITVKGLISLEHIPKHWGLIEVDILTKKARIVYNPYGKGNIYSKWKKCYKNQKAELAILYSALRRLHNKKLLTQEILREE